jgi:hypothetical protein
LQFVDDLDQSLARLGEAGGLEDPADRGGDHGLLGPADMAEHVTQEMDGAALPGTAQHLSDRGLEALVGIGDAQPDPGQPAGAQATQELPPERLGLGLAHVGPQHLTAAALVHAVGDHQRLVAHPTGFADPFDLGVQPQIRIPALQRSLREALDLLVQPAAQPRDLVLAHPGHPELLDQPIHPPGADPVDIGLLDDRDQRLLGAPAWLQKRRKVRALAQPGDRELQLTDPGVPDAGSVAVAMGHPLRGPFAELGADLRGDLGFHQLGGHPRRAVAQHVGVLVNQQLVGELGGGHPGPVGHRGSPFVALREQTDDSQTPRWPNSQSTVQSAGAVTPLSPTRPLVLP